MSILKIKGSALPTRETPDDGDYLFVISGGVTYKMLRSVFLAGISNTTPQSYITTLGTINIAGDQVTFTGFAWKIDGVDYAQTVPIVRTLPFAAIGMYRTHTAYFTNTNSIEIAVGPEDDEITTEPSIPPGTLRMRAFNVFGEVITIGTGETLPYDINLLDELLQNPASGDMMLINVGGVDYRVNFQRLIDVLGGGSSVPDATDAVKGIMKLYTALGTNTDGTINQAVLKTLFDAKSNKTIVVEKISGTKTLSNADIDKVFYLTSSCVVTIPNGLMAGFNCTFRTAVGATYSQTLGGSVVFIGNIGSTMQEASSFTMANTATTNEYLITGAL